MGFATLPNQVHRKSVKKGFDFTLMVAGQFVDQDAKRDRKRTRFTLSCLVSCDIPG